jgi:hypothetical protein
MTMLPDRETRQNVRSLYFGIGILVLFVVSFVKSCDEVRYAISGETTRAIITKETAYSGRSAEVAIEYQFEDLTGARQKGHASFKPDSWVKPADRMIEIVYLPGNPRKSVPVEKRSAVWFCILLGMTAVGVGWTIIAYRKASQGRL